MSKTDRTDPTKQSEVDLPLSHSVGYQIRATHRIVQRYLQLKIGPHEITLGMWYFFRVLWIEDGLTQRELSRRVGAMEPTTLSAIQAMQSRGFVKRVRDADDKRKWNIFLTERGRALQAEMLPVAIDVVADAVEGFSEREVDLLLSFLKSIQKNIQTKIEALGVVDPIADGEV